VKQKQRILECPTGSNLEELSEVESQHSIYEEEEQRKPVRARRPLSILNLMIFELIFSNLKANSILRSFLTS